MHPETRYLVVISGPTASGKTGIAIAVAQHFHTEIISADARQFYREMQIGTAKPSPAELALVKHHFIDTLSISEPYDAGKYEQEVIQLLDILFRKKNILILCGGSGLFINAITRGLDTFPEIDPPIREQLSAQLVQEGLVALQEELKQKDPDYYAKADVQNPQRVLRALEVIRSTGMPFSSFHSGEAKHRDFTVLHICIETERTVLYDRINARVDKMMAAGLLEEARALYPQRSLNALQTVGYQELFDYFENKISLGEAVARIKQNTRRYAKRQMTWFRKQSDIHLMPGDAEKIIQFIEKNTGTRS